MLKTQGNFGEKNKAGAKKERNGGKRGNQKGRKRMKGEVSER